MRHRHCARRIGANRGSRHAAGAHTDPAGWTAIDSAEAGFVGFLLEGACRGIDTAGSVARACTDMDAAGVRRISASDGQEAGRPRSFA